MMARLPIVLNERGRGGQAWHRASGPYRFPGPTAGVDPQIMGTGPIPASRKALEKAGWKAADLDLVEANEGVRRTGLRGQQGNGLEPPDIVNVNGGAIAIGPSDRALRARVSSTRFCSR